jgi:hypothetical protein
MEGRSKLAAPLGRSRFKGPWPLRTAAMVSDSGSHVNNYRGASWEAAQSMVRCR